MLYCDNEVLLIFCFFKPFQRIGAVVDEPPVQRILYRQPDSPVSCLCINSVSYII